MNRIKTEVKEVSVLLRSIPSLTMTLFIVSVITMNLLANKSINLPFSFMALDCGIVVSWLSFLCMDVITKHFGPKAATQASLVAVLVNLGNRNYLGLRRRGYGALPLCGDDARYQS